MVSANGPTKTIVTLPNGSEIIFPTVSWHRRWEPTDLDLYRQRRPNEDGSGRANADDMPKIADVRAINVLVIDSMADVPDGQQRPILAVFKDWVAVRME